MREVDLLIVGQGIAGTAIAHYAIQRGLKIAVVDQALPGLSTCVAGGLINPVTGRRTKKSWMYDELYPELKKFYSNIDQLLGVQTFYEMPIYRLLSTAEDLNNWESQRLEADYVGYMKEIARRLDERLHPHDGAGVIQGGGFVKTTKLLNHFRTYIQTHHILIEKELDYSDFKDHTYLDITFKKVIFCEGYRVHDNPFFQEVNLWATKGEVLEIQIDGPDFNFIPNKHIFFVPLGEGRYKVGSTLDRNINTDITPEALQELQEKIRAIIQVPFTVIGQEAGIRPNVRDRKPLLGVSLQQENYYLFNGLGSKGLSLAPYFAKHLLQHIYEDVELLQEVNWQRVLK